MPKLCNLLDLTLVMKPSLVDESKFFSAFRGLEREFKLYCPAKQCMQGKSHQQLHLLQRDHWSFLGNPPEEV